MGDAIVAVGVYHNKKIKPQYKYIKSYSPQGKFELKTNYLGFEIVSRIDLKRKYSFWKNGRRRNHIMRTRTGNLKLRG